ncbi:MFS transporter [Bacillus sp. PS06]|uniref:MFS transporter n=1 Tax=Bacillus sp. PS06 TaxID=2764176 RepID=UPI00177BCA81|nr:MFS transporter [Bacillus sp. PS06]MBD8070584.1 MFS transporter [Bacillus sp. PS06]
MVGVNSKKMKTVRKISTVGISVGLISMLIGLVVSGFNPAAFVPLLGGGIIYASMVFFGFGLFLCLIEEIADKAKGEV